MLLHILDPDKNPKNKKEAEEKFKQISHAYATLSDKDKRKQYDIFGENYEQGSGGRGHAGFTHVDPNEIFKHFFGDEDLGDIFGSMGGGLGGATTIHVTTFGGASGFSQTTTTRTQNGVRITKTSKGGGGDGGMGGIGGMDDIISDLMGGGGLGSGIRIGGGGMGGMGGEGGIINLAELLGGSGVGAGPTRRGGSSFGRATQAATERSRNEIERQVRQQRQRDMKVGIICTGVNATKHEYYKKTCSSTIHTLIW